MSGSSAGAPISIHFAQFFLTAQKLPDSYPALAANQSSERFQPPAGAAPYRYHRVKRPALPRLASRS